VSGLDLFDPPGEAYARRDDPETSHEAAKKVDATKREKQAIDGLRGLGGEGNSKEIAAFMGVDKWSISPRMKPLEKKGLVERTEKRRGGSIVWRLVA
jgi:DNA-binding MarR family transcriptional regulator